MGKNMNKNDSAVLLYAELLKTHLNDPRISDLNRNARYACVAELAVYCAELMDAAFQARDEDLQAFKKEVRDIWRLAQK
jgi:hypothetical protein